jgi:hypothetical protein
MNAMVNRLRQLTRDQLLSLSEAIDAEMERRGDLTEEAGDSARRRAVMRQQSYRRSTGSHAPPVYAAGLGKRRRFAA